MNIDVEGLIATLRKPKHQDDIDVLIAADVIEKLHGLLNRSVRVVPCDFGEERGRRFLIGEDHIIGEWRGDGLAVDTVFVEKPKLTYFVTSTPWSRCVRKAIEMIHWEIVSAMIGGPGDGELVSVSERMK